MRFLIILSLISGCSFLIPKDAGKDESDENISMAEIEEPNVPETEEEIENSTPTPVTPDWDDEKLEPVPVPTPVPTPVNTKKVDGKLNIKIRKTCKDGVLHYIIRFQQGDRIETKCGTLWEC